MVARRSAARERTRAINQARALILTGPGDLRARFTRRTPAALVAGIARLRPRPGDVMGYAVRIALRELGRRAEFLDGQLECLDELIAPLAAARAPGLLALYGIGPRTAALLLIAAGDHPGRLRSEAAWAHLCAVAPIPASSGKVTRHRLNPGGDRQANHALWRIVFTRMGSDAATRAYVERRTGRAVEVLHDRGSGRPAGVDRWTGGSGYLIGGRLVLTAAHTVDYRQDRGQDEQLLVRTIAGRELTARVILVCDEPSQVDLALVEITDARFDEHLPLAGFVRVNRDSPAPVPNCWAVGFPRFGEAGPVLAEGSRRETWHVGGEIWPGGKLRAGLLSLQVTSTPQPLPASLAGSPWEGMSGAAVFTSDSDGGELAVGVAALHHRPEGESALTVVPITALAGFPGRLTGGTC